MSAREFTKGVPAAAPTRPIPPFTEEHGELRESIAPLRGQRAAPARERVGGGRLVPERGVRQAGGQRLPRPEVPRGLRRRGRRPPARRRVHRGAGRVRLGRRGRRDRRAHRDRHPAGVQVRHRGAEAALPGAGDQGRADRRAGHHRARRRLGRGRHQDARREGGRRLRGQRLEDVHHQRRARRLRGHGGQDHRRGRPLGPVVPAAGERHGGLQRLEEAGQDGLARLRHGRAGLRRRVRARREPARRGEQGLLPDHGQLPVGAAADGAGRRRARCSG